MSSFDFVRPSGQWTNEMVPGALDYQRFDDHQSRAVNGDTGGSWSPSQPIVIGGAGLQSSASGTLLEGGASTATGGRLVVAASAGDFPQLSPSRSRTITVPVIDLLSTAGVSGINVVRDDVHGWGIAAPPGASSFVTVYVEIGGRYLHAGARLASASIEFVVTKQPAALPSQPLGFVILSADDTGAPAASQLNPTALVNLTTWFQPWTPSLGQYVIPSTPAKMPTNPLDASGVYYKCTTTGAVGATEPNWSTAVTNGSTIADGSAVWTCMGRAGVLAFGGLSTPSYWANGAPQTISYDFDGTSGLDGTTNIISIAQRYQLDLAQLNSDSGVVVTGLQLTFDTITSMAFA
ncbi:MAG TPA: hypothetical protein VGG39_08805 [Polyangiaceae bacterium]|jgi:hypothetical protein